MNVSSRCLVPVDRHWYTGETLARFAVVLGGCKFEATMACSEGAGHVNEVSLTVEDADGAAVSGEGALRLLAEPPGEEGRGGEREPEEAKRRCWCLFRGDNHCVGTSGGARCTGVDGLRPGAGRSTTWDNA